MIKLMSVLKKKTGMSREDFIAHYENIHAPLAVKLLGMGYDYRRSYLVPGAAEIGAVVDFDVVTEIRFHDADALGNFMTKFNQPEVQLILSEDEKKFLDPDRRAFVVEEFTTLRSDNS